MPIGITEEHVALRRGRRRLGRAALPARRTARSWTRPRGVLAAVLGRARRPGLGSGSTSTRPTAAPATAWRSWRSSSRGLGRVLAPGPVPPTTLAAAALQRGGGDAAAKALLPGLVAGDERRRGRGGRAGAGCRRRGDGRTVVRVSGHGAPGTRRAPGGGPDRAGGGSAGRGVVRAGRGGLRGSRELPSVDSEREVGARRWRRGRCRRRAGAAAARRSTRRASRISPRRWRRPSSSGWRSGASTTAAEYAKDRRAVRPADRPVPGREAPLRRHARSRRARARRGVGRGRARSATPRPRRSRPPPRRRSRSTASSLTRRTASRCWAASASPGSTTRTCSCSGPWRLHAACSAARRPWQARVGPARARGARSAASRRPPARGRDAPRASCARSLAELARPRAQAERRRRLADAGLPRRRTGRSRGGGTPTRVEQLVIDEEFRRRGRGPPDLAVGGWALPPIIGLRHRRAAGAVDPADAAGRDRVVPDVQRARRGLRPRRRSRRGPTRVEGGWSVSGQKVWTSMAAAAPTGASCLARTDPEAPKHEGIGCFMLDMTTPGIDVRPLRELTGMAMFNEVFLDDVFVPDDCLVGQEHDGWQRGPHHAGQRAGVDGQRARRSAPASRQSSTCVRATRPRADDRACSPRSVAWSPTRTRSRCSASGSRSRALAGADPSGPRPACASCSASSTTSACRRSGSALLGGEGAIADGAGAAWAGGFLVQPRPDDRRRHQRDPAQHHRRARAGPARDP